MPIHDHNVIVCRSIGLNGSQKNNLKKTKIIKIMLNQNYMDVDNYLPRYFVKLTVLSE